MRQPGGDLAAITEQNFDSEGARIADKWKPSRRAIEQKGQTLRDSTRLVSSLGVGGKDHVEEVGPTYVFVGTNVEYAAIHQFGGEIRQAAQSRIQGFKVNKRTGKSRFAKRGKANFEQWTSRKAYTITIPARPFFGLNAQDEQDIAETIAKALDNALK